MIKLLFWGLVALDALGIGLWFVLGLAAAGSSKTSPLSVAFYLLILPAIPLLISIALFVRGGSPAVRIFAFLLAAAPLLVLVGTQAYTAAQFRANSNESGELTFFKAGPSREIVEAIRRNDAPTVAALAPQVDVNARGMDDMTLLVSALRQLRKTPDSLDVLRALLKAGADPTIGTDYERPLEMGIQVPGKNGVEVVRLLLDAGANPNVVNSFGTPVFFQATGVGADQALLTLLLDRGANINAVAKNGETMLISAINSRNWNAVLLLLQRGADFNLGKNLRGLSPKELAEAQAGSVNGDSTYLAVINYMRTH